MNSINNGVASGKVKFRFKWLLLILAMFIPIIISNQYVCRVINMVLIYSIIALSINVIVGLGGQLDMGRAAFVGIGMYWSAIAMLKFNLPWFFAFISAGLVCAFFGFLLGMICRKTSFDYLTLITIGFNQICFLIFLNWIPVTNGAMGIRLVPPPKLFGFEFNTNTRYFYFAFFLLAICYIMIRRIMKSKIGRAFEALRDDPIAASYSGINIAKYKMYNFIIGSFFTGIAGSALVHYTRYAHPFMIKIDESIYMLQMAILGGLGSLPGSILGSAILVIAPEISRTFYQYRLMFVGMIMVVMMIWAPNGILGRNGIGEKIIGIERVRRILKKKADGSRGDAT